MNGELLESILWIMKIGFFLVEVFSMAVWRRSVKGTHRRYMAKSATKLLIMLLFISTFFHGVVAWAIAEDASVKGWTWALTALYFIVGGLDYRTLNQDDEDDFFSKSYKKARRWMKDFSVSLRRRRLAYVKP